MSSEIPDRRQTPRFYAHGPVEILFEDPMPVTVEAELFETSVSGFRIVHASRRLVPGLEVSLKSNGATQRARVVWTHILQGRRVSGCLFLA